MKKITYKKAGVDIKKADQFVGAIKSFVARDALSTVGAFGSLYSLEPFTKHFKNPVLVSSTDGVGTKLILAQDLDIHHTVGIDLVAMNVNDVICMGAQPLFFLDYIACGKVKPAVLRKVVSGIHKGLQESNCLLIGGETAEMPGMYKKDEYDLAGFCVGIVNRDKIINGKNIKAGDRIIGLASSGFHSNGFSLVRKALSDKELKNYAGKLLEPTRIYVKPIQALLHNAAVQPCVKGIAHITGGAFYSKAVKILPKNYGMVIRKGSWNIPSVFHLVQTAGNINEKEMYSVFNMGIGMMVVVDQKAVRKSLEILNALCEAHVIGEIVKSEKRIVFV